MTLPVSDLAMQVLRDFAAAKGWNSYNWLLEARQNERGIDDEALRALAEAWQWLYSAGLVATTPGQSSPHSCFVTRRGHRAIAEGPGALLAEQRLSLEMHPALERSVRRQYLLGEYELAVFAAMREVEIRVRTLGKFPNSLLGTKLMQEAFKTGGPLFDAQADPGEQVAMMELFKGAIGVFKNPTSHRAVNYSDPVAAAETILLADLLLRTLDDPQ